MSCYTKKRVVARKHRFTNDGLNSHCKACTDAQAEAWARKNPGKRKRSWRRYAYLRNYDATLEELEELLAAQDGLCAICGKRQGGERPLCVDHDHATGAIRGLLCNGCNVVLGHAKDSVEILERAIAYLKFHKGRG